MLGTHAQQSLWSLQNISSSILRNLNLHLPLSQAFVLPQFAGVKLRCLYSKHWILLQSKSLTKIKIAVEIFDSCGKNIWTFRPSYKMKKNPGLSLQVNCFLNSIMNFLLCAGLCLLKLDIITFIVFQTSTIILLPKS